MQGVTLLYAVVQEFVEVEKPLSIEHQMLVARRDLFEIVDRRFDSSHWSRQPSFELPGDAAFVLDLDNDNLQTGTAACTDAFPKHLPMHWVTRRFHIHAAHTQQKTFDGCSNACHQHLWLVTNNAKLSSLLLLRPCLYLDDEMRE